MESTKHGFRTISHRRSTVTSPIARGSCPNMAASSTPEGMSPIREGSGGSGVSGWGAPDSRGGPPTKGKWGVMGRLDGRLNNWPPARNRDMGPREIRGGEKFALVHFRMTKGVL